MENERKDIKYYAQRNIKVENLIHFGSATIWIGYNKLDRKDKDNV